MDNPLITIGVLIAVGIIWLFFRYRQVQAFDRQRHRAIKATAKLIRVDRSQLSKRSGEILANIAIEVHPPEGVAYSLYDIDWYIQPAAATKFQAGLEMNVRIDAKDPRVIFPAEHWARVA